LQLQTIYFLFRCSRLMVHQLLVFPPEASRPPFLRRLFHGNDGFFFDRGPFLHPLFAIVCLRLRRTPDGGVFSGALSFWCFFFFFLFSSGDLMVCSSPPPFLDSVARSSPPSNPFSYKPCSFVRSLLGIRQGFSNFVLFYPQVSGFDIEFLAIPLPKPTPPLSSPPPVFCSSGLFLFLRCLLFLSVLLLEPPQKFPTFIFLFATTPYS